MVNSYMTKPPFNMNKYLMWMKNIYLFSKRFLSRSPIDEVVVMASSYMRLLFDNYNNEKGALESRR